MKRGTSEFTEIDWAGIKHFSPDEFDDPGYPGSHNLIYPATVTLLDALRDETGWPIITHNKFGLRGCVCVENNGHSENSLHYPPHCSAVDFHFDIPADLKVSPREQALVVLQSGFSGVGIYYDWKWDGKPLPIGFHVDLRPTPQVWKRIGGTNYIYFLK